MSFSNNLKKRHISKDQLIFLKAQVQSSLEPPLRSQMQLRPVTIKESFQDYHSDQIGIRLIKGTTTFLKIIPIKSFLKIFSLRHKLIIVLFRGKAMFYC